MINVSEIVTDPDFAQTLTIQRSAGRFASGGFVNTTTSLNAAGVVVVAAEEDLEQIGEGDRVVGAMEFYTTVPIYETRTGAKEGLSDVIAWNGQQYRLAKVWPWRDYGYYRAIGIRMSGA